MYCIMTSKIWLIDIDGTICEDIPNESPELVKSASFYQDALTQINKWYSNGDTIFFFTAGLEEHRDVTERWLLENGFNYHGIIFNKPRITDNQTYHWIDNKPVRATQFVGTFGDMIKANKTIEIFKKN